VFHGQRAARVKLERAADRPGVDLAAEQVSGDLDLDRLDAGDRELPGDRLADVEDCKRRDIAYPAALADCYQRRRLMTRRRQTVAQKRGRANGLCGPWNAGTSVLCLRDGLAGFPWR
jgi:hypothetical protein